MGSIDDLAPVGKYLPSSLNHLEQIAPGLELVFQTVGLGAPRQELHRDTSISPFSSMVRY